MMLTWLRRQVSLAQINQAHVPFSFRTLPLLRFRNPITVSSFSPDFIQARRRVVGSHTQVLCSASRTLACLLLVGYVQAGMTAWHAWHWHCPGGRKGHDSASPFAAALVSWVDTKNSRGIDRPGVLHCVTPEADLCFLSLARLALAPPRFRRPWTGAAGSWRSTWVPLPCHAMVSRAASSCCLLIMILIRTVCPAWTRSSTSSETLSYRCARRCAVSFVACTVLHASGGVSCAATSRWLSPMGSARVFLYAMEYPRF